MANDHSNISSAWSATLLRLTVFVQAGNVIDGANWWEEVVGEQPETRTIQPKTKESSDSGSFGNGQLILTTQPLRVDWYYAVEETEGLSDQFDILGEFYDALSTFEPIMLQWLRRDDLPPILRIAFGAILIQPVTDREMGYNLLSNLLPFTVDTENTSDFSYQINRKRVLREFRGNMAVNRLSKWGVIVRKSAVIDPTRTANFATSQVTAARLELDINSAPDNELQFSEEERAMLFAHLISLAKEISVRGDVP